MHACACTYACMHVCMHVCMYVCMHICMCVRACVGGCVRVCVCVCTFLEHDIRGSQPLRVFKLFSAVSIMSACAINIVRKFCIAGGQEPIVTCPGQRRPGDVGVQTYLQTLGPCAKIRVLMLPQLSIEHTVCSYNMPQPLTICTFAAICFHTATAHLHNTTSS